MIRAITHPHLATLLRRLASDSCGATLTEFAFVGPVLILMIMGLFDMAHTQYTNAMINGAMQKAGRDLTLENAANRQAIVDQRVRTAVLSVVPGTATVDFEKLAYADFNDIAEPEEFDDDNNDGICNDGEVFVDANRNGQWDADRGSTGIGGARDAVLYTVTVSYPRLFPMYGLAGLPQNVSLQASTVLRNQPYDEQDRTVETGNCS